MSHLLRVAAGGVARGVLLDLAAEEGVTALLLDGAGAAAYDVITVGGGDMSIHVEVTAAASAAEVIRHISFGPGAGAGTSGLIVRGSGNPLVANCTVTDHEDGVYMESGRLHHASIYGCELGVELVGESPVMVNTAVGASSFSPLSLQGGATIAQVTRCCLQGGAGGGDNIYVDPQYVQPPVNLQPVSGSPLINAGSNSIMGVVDDDLRGVARGVGGIVDIGAFEDLGAYANIGRAGGEGTVYWKLNTTYRTTFVILDNAQDPVTGLVDANFGVVLLHEDDVSPVDVTITEVDAVNAPGIYSAAYTPSALGHWTLYITHATYQKEGMLSSIDVVRMTESESHLVAGLLHNNGYMDSTVYDATSLQLSSARLRLFDTAANATAATDDGSAETGTIATFIITATMKSDGTVDTYRVVRDDSEA